MSIALKNTMAFSAPDADGERSQTIMGVTEFLFDVWLQYFSKIRWIFEITEISSTNDDNYLLVDFQKRSENWMIRRDFRCKSG